MTSRLQQRRDTAANWTSNNPTLAAGEIGLETNTNLFKVGDGTTVNRSSPVQLSSFQYVSPTAVTSSWKFISAGAWTSGLIRSSDSSLWVSGYNAGGGLGEQNRCANVVRNKPKLNKLVR